MRVLLVNPTAHQMRRRPGLLAQVRGVCRDDWAVIHISKNPEDTAQALNHLMHLDEPLREVIVLGGDGTFRTVLNWCLALPEERRPILTPIGGGQFCYVATFAGFGRNPVKNLERLRREEDLVSQAWRPLRVENQTRQHVTHAALYADGVVADFVALYVEGGKGGLPATIGHILWVVFRVIFLNDLGRFRKSCGSMRADTKEIPSPRATAVLSAIPSPMPFSRPFQGTPKDGEFYFITWWNSLPRLALAALPIWAGYMTPWGRGRSANYPVGRVVLTHDSEHITLDGDLFPLQQGDVLSITCADSVQIRTTRKPQASRA